MREPLLLGPPDTLSWYSGPAFLGASTATPVSAVPLTTLPSGNAEGYHAHADRERDHETEAVYPVLAGGLGRQDGGDHECDPSAGPIEDGLHCGPPNAGALSPPELLKPVGHVVRKPSFGAAFGCYGTG